MVSRDRNRPRAAEYAANDCPAEEYDTSKHQWKGSEEWPLWEREYYTPEQWREWKAWKQWPQKNHTKKRNSQRRRGRKAKQEEPVCSQGEEIREHQECPRLPETPRSGASQEVETCTGLKGGDQDKQQNHNDRRSTGSAGSEDTAGTASTVPPPSHQALAQIRNAIDALPEDQRRDLDGKLDLYSDLMNEELRELQPEEVKGWLKVKDRDIKFWKAAHEAVEAKLNQSWQDLQSANMLVEHEQLQKKAMEEELASVRKALQETREEVETHENWAQYSSRTIFELSQQLEDAEDWIEQLLEEARDGPERRLEMQKDAEEEVARRDRLIEILQDNLEAAEEERDALGSCLEVSTHHATELENDLAWLQMELNQSWQHLRNANIHVEHDLKLRNQELEVNLTSQSRIINALEDRLNTSDRDLQFAERQLQRERMQKEAMEKELSSLQKALDEAKQKAKEDLTRLKNLLRELHDANVQVELMQQRQQAEFPEAGVLQKQDACQETAGGILDHLPNHAHQRSFFLPDEFLPLLFDFLSVVEVAEMQTRAVSSFFSNSKVWVSHLFKLMDFDSVLEHSSDESHPVYEFLTYRNAVVARDVSRSGSEGLQGYRLWFNGHLKWHAHHPEMSSQFVEKVMDWYLFDKKILSLDLGWHMCSALLVDGIRDFRLDIAKGLLPVLCAHHSSPHICKWALKCLQACQASFPFLSRHFAKKLVELSVAWMAQEGDSWKELVDASWAEILHIFNVILPVDEAHCASRCANAICDTYFLGRIRQFDRKKAELMELLSR